MPQSWNRSALALGSWLYALATPALGADPLYSPAPVASGEWIVTVKGTVGVQPDYVGSDKTSLFGYPSISLRRAGAPVAFSAPDDGIGIALYEASGFRVGPVARFRAGRYTGDDRRLIGLDDVRWAIEPGLFAEFYPVDGIRVRAEVRRGFNGHEGVVGTLGVDGIARAGAFTFSGGPRLEFGDTTFARDVFGVTPREAAWNGLVTPYRPTGGFTAVGAAAAVTYAFSPSWSTTVFGGYKRLVGPAADSPVTRRFGSPNQLTAGVSLAYSFSTSGW